MTTVMNFKSYFSSEITSAGIDLAPEQMTAETRPSMDASDYRNSHLSAEKPLRYQRQFEDSTNVKGLYWSLEQRILDRLLPCEQCVDLDYLDFACGTGRILAHLSPRFRRSVGVDVSENMLNVARTRCKAEFVLADVTRDSALADRRFDLITAFRFFLNAQSELRAEALSWIHQHLNDSGSLICNFHLNPHSMVGTKMRIMKRLRHWQTPPMMSLGNARCLLHEHGFRVRSVWGYGYFYYGRHELWAPFGIIRPIEAVATKLLPARLARNFIIMAEKSK